MRKGLYRRLIYKIVDVKEKFNSKLRIWSFSFHPDIHIGRNVFIGRNVNISCIWGGTIKIGNNTIIRDGAKILTYGGDISIGERCTINPYCIIYGQGGTKIGNNVLMAGHTMVVPQNHTFNKKGLSIRDSGSTEKGIIIEDNVWIAHGCSILDGVTIKTGSVIAAGSVVNKSTDPFTVYGGVPAKLLKSIE